MNWLSLVGIVIFVVGLLVSIALHELGHLSFAKLFGVRTTQYMVGFGPTLWSRQRGETEYGIKWIPLGGYIRMIGMLPPRKGETRPRRSSTGPFQGLIESARGAALEEVRPGDEDRVFYRKPWWQKLIIMSAGPGANIVLAAFLLAVVFMGFGVQTPKPVVQTVAECTPAAADRDCGPGDQPAPAARAGLRPGDRIVGFNGTKITSWEQLTKLIRGSGGKSVTLTVERGKQRLPVPVDLVRTQRPALEDGGKPVTAGFLGVGPQFVHERQGPGMVAGAMWDLTSRMTGALVTIPQRMVEVWKAAFAGDERKKDGPVGIVGASRIGGEIAAQPVPPSDRIAQFLLLLGSFNLAIAVFNLVPLLPLDGGHIAGALWEALRRGFARLFRRPDPGYVDVARALPLAYGMAIVIIAMGVLLIYADLVNPIRLNG
jgi:membrane-associated protease RseP (regulator of RpoE activity)